MCSGWMGAAKAAGIETVGVGSPLGLLLSVKDGVEVDMIKRAAILTNKVPYPKDHTPHTQVGTNQVKIGDTRK